MAKKSRPPLHSAQRALPKRCVENWKKSTNWSMRRLCLKRAPLLYELDRDYPSRLEVVGYLAEVSL